MNEKRELDSGLLFGGFVTGLVIGGIVALFKAPRSGQALRQQLSENTEQIREKIESARPVDPLAESIAEGKAAAKRRRQELGFRD